MTKTARQRTPVLLLPHRPPPHLPPLHLPPLHLPPPRLPPPRLAPPHLAPPSSRLNSPHFPPPAPSRSRPDLVPSDLPRPAHRCPPPPRRCRCTPPRSPMSTSTAIAAPPRRKTCASTIPSISRPLLPPQMQEGSLGSTATRVRECGPGEDDGHGRVSRGKDCSLRCVACSPGPAVFIVVAPKSGESRLDRGAFLRLIGPDSDWLDWGLSSF